MSTVLVGKMQQDADVDALWNNFLDDYEAEGNGGNESLVGAESNPKVLAVIVQKQRSVDPISITKPSTLEPNSAPGITFRPLILQGVREVVVMPSNGLNARVPSQTSTLVGNVAPRNLQTTNFCAPLMQGGLGGFPNFTTMG
jgi:hypothetical protein